MFVNRSAAMFFMFICMASNTMAMELCETNEGGSREIWGEPARVDEISGGLSEWIYIDKKLIFLNHRLVKVVDPDGIETSTVKCKKAAKKEDKSMTPIVLFRSETQYQTMMCNTQTKTALMQYELGSINSVIEPISKCINGGKLAVKPLFQKAYASIIKKNSAAKALKQYYIEWLSGFESIMPRSDDRVIDYRKRVADAEQKIESAWTNFVVENDM